MGPEVWLQWIKMLNKTVGLLHVLCHLAWTNCISRDYYWGTLFISSNHFSDKIFFPVTNFLQVCNKFWQAKQNSDFYRKAIQSWNNVILSSPRQDISIFIVWSNLAQIRNRKEGRQFVFKIIKPLPTHIAINTSNQLNYPRQKYELLWTLPGCRLQAKYKLGFGFVH